MKIQVGGLSDGIHEYRFQAAAGEMVLGEEFSEVRAEVSLDKVSGQIHLKAKLDAEARFSCDRCTTPFSMHLTPSYEMHYVWEGADTSRYDSSEVQVLPPGVSVIDITEDVRQTFLIAVPLKLLCREDCRGLCPHCGKNLNEASCSCTAVEADPRWEKLAMLKKNTTQDSR